MPGYKDPLPYQKAFALAMEIFEISQGFPQDERYSLTDQIERAPDQFVQILQKRSSEENIQLILSAN